MTEQPIELETIPLEDGPAAPPPAAPPALAAAPHGPWGSAHTGWFVALMGWTILLSLFNLSGGAEFEPTDCWVGQTAREMAERGDWLIPRFSGEARFQKSPGPYWAVMLAARLGDGVIDKAATRLPNALAAVALVGVVFWLTGHIAGQRAAVFAGFAAASSSLVLYWSHRGASDLGLATLVTVSLACLWVATSRPLIGWKGPALLLVGYFAAGVGMLYKMPMPLVCVFLPMGVYVLLRRQWSTLRSKWHLLGLALFLLPWVPWVVAVILREPTALAKWRVEFLDRFTGDLPNVEEQRNWRYYFVYLIPPLVYTLPYTLSLPGAFLKAFRPRAGVNRDGMAFLLIWFFALLAFFTAAVGKETRYFLPALPPLFIILGCELADFFDPRRPAAAQLLRWGARAVWVLVPLGLLGGTWGLYIWQRHEFLFTWSQVWPPYLVMAVLFTAGTALSAWLYRRRLGNHAFAALVGTMWATWLWTWPQLMPVVVSQKQSINFAAQLRERLPAEYRSRLRQVGSQDARVVWYSDVRMPRIIDQLELLRMQGGRRSLEREERLVADEMIRALEGDEPVLLVACRPDYIRFLVDGPLVLAAEGRSMPANYLWLQTEVGRKASKHFVVFGNRPPPWPEPALNPPSERLNVQRVTEERVNPSPGPTSQPAASRPGPSTAPSRDPGAAAP